MSSTSYRDDWFTKLTGFSERDPSEVRSQLTYQDGRLTSVANGKSFQCGELEVVSLRELRARVAHLDRMHGSLSVEQKIGDVREMHADNSNAGATFQVASQFNLLEMVSPQVTPDQGVGIYEHDPTQGPACAISCGAGTIYRNYLVPIGDQIGQTANCQVDCLEAIGKRLGNDNGRLWKMQNGYALPTEDGLREINSKLQAMSEDDLDALRGDLKIGIHSQTQVTIGQSDHVVTQVYCSAMPVAYSELDSTQWQPFASLVLDAAYEATFAAAVLNSVHTGNQQLYLTLLGGGAFGNPIEWIVRSIKRACIRYRSHPINVSIVSYRQPNDRVEQLVESFKQATDAKPVESSLPDHRCPVCGSAQKPFLRYPWYICNSCLKLAQDDQGRKLEFGNTSFSGGLNCKYADEDEERYIDCGSVICLILGRPVIVTEARFGGVVAQPMHSNLLLPGSDNRCVDLRRPRK
ncbi:hypothetical protein LOC67_16390 [Stieleria sp. JC731]|uniref:hypothetical protein n=1 Tax=Pirellulaceae TaxID=2691357 RepID=UPI001E2AD240|nr:hypothetical protein [Stieleria sp. JC731]MCC9602139.1 hypothetical protein [Stieleria sp. JC731]